MKKLGTGMTAVSLAGHDTGKRYMIMKAEGEYVYLADGKIRTIENQKKKKVKHIPKGRAAALPFVFLSGYSLIKL